MEDFSKGLHRNIYRFILLVLINGCVGAMVGLERTIFPAMAQSLFGMTAHTAILSFIALFGATKAATNYFPGSLADTIGERRSWLPDGSWPCLFLCCFLRRARGRG